MFRAESGAGTAFPAQSGVAEARLTQHQPVAMRRARRTREHAEGNRAGTRPQATPSRRSKRGALWLGRSTSVAHTSALAMMVTVGASADPKGHSFRFEEVKDYDSE